MNYIKTHSHLILLYTGLTVLLFAVWSPAFLLTGDGACHLYNAKIIAELWKDGNASFYSTYFDFNTRLSPNWTGHLLLTPFVSLFNAAITEKFFFSMYILLFVFGWYMLIREIDKKQLFLIGIVFLFVFNHPLFKGFYNYSVSISLFAWLIWSWLLYCRKRFLPHLIIISAVSILILFSHPIGYLFSAFIALLLISGKELLGDQKIHFSLKGWVNICSIWCVINIPLLYFTFNFSTGVDNRNIHLAFNDNISRLLCMTSFINLSSRESFLLSLSGITIFGSFIVFIFYRIKTGKKLHLSDFILLALFFIGIYYFLFPENFGCDLMELRVQVIIFLTIYLFILLTPGALIIKKILTAFCFFSFIILMSFRIPLMVQIGNAGKEIYDCSRFIQPFSSVLPLSFSHNGIDSKGQKLADRNWVFVHCAQYMGVDKPLLFIDNYEAHLKYFPLVWKEKYNPYKHLSGYACFENENPNAEISYYNSSTGNTIDYILMWCYDSMRTKDKYELEMHAQIDSFYHIIHISKTGRARLFAINQ